MIKGTTQMSSVIDVKTEDIINNIQINDDLPTYGHMLKMDETYCDAEVRSCQLDNKLYGFCYLHGKYLNLEFNSFENVNMSEKLDKDEIHVPKEYMVMAVSSNSYKKNAHPVLIWPTCSKSEVNIQMELIQTLPDGFYFKNNAPFMCWSTDVDATHRRIFDSLMRFELCESSLIYPIISVLLLIDLCVGANEETVDFDIWQREFGIVLSVGIFILVIHF